MPLEDTPNFLQEDNERQPVPWIEQAAFDLHKGNEGHLTYEQLQEKKILDMTRTAVGAASQYVSGRVENNKFVNTPPEAAALEPITVETLHYSQLSEPVYGDRVESFRQDAILGREPRSFVDLQSKTKDDFRLGA